MGSNTPLTVHCHMDSNTPPPHCTLPHKMPHQHPLSLCTATWAAYLGVHHGESWAQLVLLPTQRDGLWGRVQRRDVNGHPCALKDVLNAIAAGSNHVAVLRLLHFHRHRLTLALLQQMSSQAYLLWKSATIVIIWVMQLDHKVIGTVRAMLFTTSMPSVYD